MGISKISVKTYKLTPEDPRNQLFKSEAETTKSFLLQLQLTLQIIATLRGKQTSEQNTIAQARLGRNTKRGER